MTLNDDNTEISCSGFIDGFQCRPKKWISDLKSTAQKLFIINIKKKNTLCT